MPSKALRQWTIPRRDLAAGGSALVRLSHPLLPVFTSARVGPRGLVLSLEGARPVPLRPLEGPERRAWLVRFGSLVGFLSFHGLGVAADDLALVGSREGEPERPALGAVPVAAWRAVPPSLAVAGAALRLAGRRIAAEDAESLRRAIEGQMDRSLPRDAAEDALSALRATDAHARVESVVCGIARRGIAGPVARDLLGLSLPAVELPAELTRRPAVAVGSASLWVARGAARRRELPEFLECAAGSALEEGGALRRIAGALGDDPRAGRILELAEGKEFRETSAQGPPISLVALSLEKWDRRSRSVFENGLSDLGFDLYAPRSASLRPWEDAPLLAFVMRRGDAASLLWLPFASAHDALAAWREAEERSGAADASRFLDVAHALAARFDPAEGRLGPARARPIVAPRPGPVLEAASLLASGFGGAEAARAAGVEESFAGEAIAAAVETGILVAGDREGFAFRDERERRRIASRVPRTARRAAVERLEEAHEIEGDGARFALASLARGTDDDLARARAALHAAVARGDVVRAAELLSRAPSCEPDLGEPLLAVRILQGAGLPDEARAAAARIDGLDVRETSLEERLATGRALVRLREDERALALCPGEGIEEIVGRAWLLVELRRDSEARELLATAEAATPGSPPGVRLLSRVLQAELHERAHEYSAAGEALASAEALLREAGDAGFAREMARTAGYLANDLGRTDEAIALFRRAESLARDPLERADALYDVAFAALDAGRFALAAGELDSALALYAASGNEARYLSALGNRIDLLLHIGDFAAARDVLARVLAHERAGGRDHRVLFALPSLQELALLDGDDSSAAAAFREAEARGAGDPRHPSWREILLHEAERLLGAQEPVAALDLLERAASLPDNSARTEARRVRLVASASGDVGHPSPAGSLSLPSEERTLLDAEAIFRTGRSAGDAVGAALEGLASSGAGAGLAVRRVLEWTGRFPEFFATSAAGPLLRLSRRIAAKSGLPKADDRFARLLEHGAPPEGPAPQRPSPAGVVAEDASTRELFAQAARIARSSISVLILGESGTGKEIVAREIHRLSGRRGPFLALNVAALPGTLAEAELFGHARGAFTGADRDRRGLVEASSGGTLFLDEIGDLPLGLQGKLLRVLQEGEVRRLGETAVRKVDLRVLAATHRPLKEMADAGSFRLDLYFRLAGLELELRPLRERPADLAALIARTLGARATPSRAAAAALASFPWPGNVRELLSALEAAVALAPGRIVEVEHLPRALRERPAVAPASGSYADALRRARVTAIDAALHASSGNRTHAARALGISRQSLLYEMKKLGVGVSGGGR